MQLAASVDDTVLEYILTHLDCCDQIHYFDFASYPMLSQRSISLLLDRCPKLEYRSFSLMNPAFLDHTVVIGETEMPTNAALLAHYVPFFQGLFASNYKESNLKMTKLEDVDLQPFQDLMRALESCDWLANEHDCNRVLEEHVAA